ncbi:MAG: XamI family restriction endonuclease [Deltaproteobacteria bacterium]|nr:XamI family restriction endonuclease [Deltaproteobacteria bacterium]
MREPLEKYLEAFDLRQGHVEDLLEKLIDMTDVASLDDDVIVEVLSDESLLQAFRYLAGPPVSADDLRVLADAPSLTPKALKQHPAMARTVFETVLQGLDRRRFPWVTEKREPSEAERQAAVVASTALMATQRLATDRRNEGKEAQEQAVFRSLRQIGFRRVAARGIATLDDAPEPGEFCPESMLGGRKADVVVRLHDRRVLAIECKVSNSSTNSIKRLNNDAAVKAVAWIEEFGTRQLRPAAVLSGVFKLRNLVDAQQRGLTLWWAHRLSKLTDWIAQARP